MASIRCGGTPCSEAVEGTAWSSTQPMKKSYFAKQPIEAPLKFSTSVNSSAGSLGLQRKDSDRLIRQPVLVGSASSKNIENMHVHSEGKQPMFKSFVQRSGTQQPPVAKLSSFGREVGQPKGVVNEPTLKMESEYGQELLRKLRYGCRTSADNQHQSSHQTAPASKQQPSEQSNRPARVASPENVLTFRKVNFRSPLRPENGPPKSTYLSSQPHQKKKECLLQSKEAGAWDSQKQLSIYLAETSTSITSLIWKTHVSQQENSPAMGAIPVRKCNSSSRHEPVTHSFTNRLSRSLSLSDFTVIKQLGKGKFGKVSLVVHSQTGFLCAMKAIGKDIIRKENLANQLAREIKIQLYLKHENLSSLYGYFDDEENVYLLMEFCADGQLYELLKERKRLSEQEARPLIRQLCEGVDYMHRHSILHRDIKPQNILLQNGVLKLCDFGWSVRMEQDMRETFCGTPLYVSPEILKGDKYDEKIDIWSLGVLSYEMLVGRIPFRIRTQEDLAKIITDSIVFPDYVPLTATAKSFINSILQKNPQQRLDLDSLLHHPFLAHNN